jgi:MFS family permease
MRRLLHNRNFCIYFAGRSVSAVGDSCYFVALILAVLQATRSVTSGSIVLLAGMLPVLLLTLFGGTVGDRLSRSRLMLATDLVRSLTQFTTAMLLVHPHPPLWALIVAQLFYGTSEAFFDPASTGLLLQIVGRDELPAANGMLQFSANAALVVGPAIAGFIIGIVGAPFAIGCDGVSFLLSAISLYYLAVPKANASPQSDSMFARFREGFFELRKRKWTLITTCYLAFLTFAFNGPLVVLGPAVSLARLGGPSAWSLILCTFGIGSICGGFVAIRLLRTKHALGWAYLSNFALMPLLCLFGTTSSKWLVAGSSGFAGIAVGLFSVTYPTLLQQNVPGELLSRVGSYAWLARVIATPLALALAGPLSTRFGITTVFDVAALTICAATFVGVSFPEIWAIEGRAGFVRPPRHK